MSLLTCTLIQTALFWEDKEANLQMLQRKIAGIKEKTQLVVLPEMFSTGFSMQPKLLAETMHGATVQWMKAIAAEKKIILTGSLIIEEEGNFYNRLIWMLPNGECGFYNKRHLFAYAGEDKHYTPGNRRLIASINGWKINLQVCYDLRFPVWARQQQSSEMGLEYDVLLYVANWPEKRSSAWKTLLQARAIENQCYVVAVNRVGPDGNNIPHSGNSMVVSPLGDVLYHKDNEEDVFTLSLDRNLIQQAREKFPFWQDADVFNILL